MANINGVSAELRSQICSQVSRLHSKAQAVDCATTYELQDLEKCLDIALEAQCAASDTVRLLEYAVAVVRQDSDCRKD